MSRLAAMALSVLLPGLLLAAAGVQLGDEEDAALAPEAAMIEARLAAASPEILVLGSSLTQDLSVERIEAATGRRTARVLVPGARAPTWYVLLKNRVYANGHRPDLVIVPATLDHMLALEVEGESDLARLAMNSESVEPVLEARMSGRRARDPRVARLDQRRVRVREHGLEAWTRAALSAFLPPDVEPLSRLDAARVAVYGEAFQLRAQEPMSTVAWIDTAAAPERPPADRGLLPDLAELARSHGSRIVFVRVPMSSFSFHPEGGDPERLREVADVLAKHGSALVDLADAGIEDRLYRNASHLGPVGAEQLTELLLPELEAIGGLAPGPLRPRERLAVARASRVGEPPPLPAIGPPEPDASAPGLLSVRTPSLVPFAPKFLRKRRLLGASPIVLLEDGAPLPLVDTVSELRGTPRPGFLPAGPTVLFRSRGASDAHDYALAWSEPHATTRTGETVYWLLPGTTLTLDLGAAATGEISALSEPLASGRATPPILHVGAASAPFVRLDGERSWARLEATGARSVRIENPVDGEPAALRSLAVGDRFVFGGAAANRAPGVRFVARSDNDVSVPTPPPAPPARLATTGPRSGSFAGDGLVPLAGACSPLRLARDGRELALDRRPCGVIAQGAPGFCHAGAKLHFRLPDGAPAVEEAPIELVYAADRLCTRPYVFWLYGGDPVTFRRTVDVDHAPSLDRLELVLAAYGATVVDLTVSAGAERLLEARAEGAALDGTPLTFRLDRRPPPGTRQVEITLTADGPAGLEQATLGAAAPLELARASP